MFVARSSIRCTGTLRDTSLQSMMRGRPLPGDPVPYLRRVSKDVRSFFVRPFVTAWYGPKPTWRGQKRGYRPEKVQLVSSRRDFFHGFTTMGSFTHLDQQLRQWSSRLRDDLQVSPKASNELATTVHQEVRALPREARERVATTERVSVAARIEELQGFQMWMDLAPSLRSPAAVRAQVITQNYICFVYLSESCFKTLAKEVDSNTATRRVCRFLCDNPVRAFRNAIAHGNWNYGPGFDRIVYWARKGADPSEDLHRFEVEQSELNFWQALARSVGYAGFLALAEP